MQITDEQAKLIGREIGKVLKTAIYESLHIDRGTRGAPLASLFVDAVRDGFKGIADAVREAKP
jgi:hypothetical protein